jgi:hypothetical protein
MTAAIVLFLASEALFIEALYGQRLRRCLFLKLSIAGFFGVPILLLILRS